MKEKIALFDVDGVLALPEEVFSIVYSRSHGLDVKPFEDFFRNEWRDIVTGRKDLKEHISENPKFWRWSGTPDELLNFWFKAEDVRNDELVEIINELKDQGISCYLATDQEKYRGQYMKDIMFKNVFDDYFISAEIGYTKTDPGFYEAVITGLQQKHPGLAPQDIIFFDDSQSKIDTALSAGIDGRLYEDVGQVRELLQAKLNTPT